jgi:hypothetical protein
VSTRSLEGSILHVTYTPERLNFHRYTHSPEIYQADLADYRQTHAVNAEAGFPIVGVLILQNAFPAGTESYLPSGAFPSDLYPHVIHVPYPHPTPVNEWQQFVLPAFASIVEQYPGLIGANLFDYFGGGGNGVGYMGFVFGWLTENTDIETGSAFHIGDRWANPLWV